VNWWKLEGVAPSSGCLQGNGPRLVVSPVTLVGGCVRNRTPSSGFGIQLVTMTSNPFASVGRRGIEPRSLALQASAKITRLAHDPLHPFGALTSWQPVRESNPPLRCEKPRSCRPLDERAVTKPSWQPVRESNSRLRFEKPRSCAARRTGREIAHVRGAARENRTHLNLATREGPVHRVGGMCTV
jgi:hypothetical protein